MALLTKLLSYWKTYLVSIEIILMLYFAFHIVGEGGISGNSFILTITFLSAALNTFFLIIFLVFAEGHFKLLNKAGQVLAILNFIYTSLVFSDLLSVTQHWIPAMISSLFVAGLALQFYIGLGSLNRLKFLWLFRINSFLIIILTFYGIFLLLLNTEKGAFFNAFYMGIALVFVLSLISNLINFRPHTKISQEAQSK